ncbi:MAG: ribbon-helix-helix protein, CopG family [Sphingomonadaceae bacterium]
MSSLTIRLDDKLDAELSLLAQETHRSKSDLVRSFIHKQLALAALKRSQQALRPFAEKAGYLTDEDFFRDFS